MVGLADAKKKKKKSTTISLTKAVNQVVPPAADPPAGIFRNGLLVSTITVGKAFKGKQIGDVNATVSYTATGVGSDLGDLTVELTAPNGASSYLTCNNYFGPTLGPLTIDDETPFSTTNSDPATDQETNTLYAPYIGRSQPCYIPLSVMDGGPAKGVWTLFIFNFEDTATEIHTFGSWGIEVKTHPAYLTK
jgi:subtilisin-like proprotein convertase family protein